MPETEDSGSSIFYKRVTEFRSINLEAPCFGQKSTYGPDRKTYLIGWVFGMVCHMGFFRGCVKVVLKLFRE